MTSTRFALQHSISNLSLSAQPRVPSGGNALPIRLAFLSSLTKTAQGFLVSITLVCALSFASSGQAQIQWDNLSDFGDDTYREPTSDEEGRPIGRAKLKAKEFFRAINDPQLQADIEQQYELIKKTQAAGNAFNHELAEHYFGYARLLREAGRVDDAARAMVDALHIQKANYGLYDPRHRGILDALFTLNFERDRPDLAEEYLQRLLLIEREIDTRKDERVFEMLVKMGHFYLNQNLDASTGSENAISTIDSALGYFRRAMFDYRGDTLDERLPPFGEYAFASFLKKKELEFTQANLTSNTNIRTASQSVIERELMNRNSFSSTRSYQNSKRALNRFLEAATEEGNQAMLVRALVSLGDLEIIYLRDRSSVPYYVSAWEEAQKLPFDDPERVNLNAVNALPNFAFSIPWERAAKPGYEKVSVPLIVSVSKKGRVSRAVVDDSANIPKAIGARALRAVRGAMFRPRVEGGQLVKISREPYEFELVVKSTWMDKVLDREPTRNDEEKVDNG